MYGPPDGSAIVCRLVPAVKVQSTNDMRVVDHRDVSVVERAVATSGGKRIEEPVPSAEPIPTKRERKGEWGVMFNVNFPKFNQQVDFLQIQVGGKTVTLLKQDVEAEPESGPVWVPWNR